MSSKAPASAASATPATPAPAQFFVIPSPEKSPMLPYDPEARRAQMALKPKGLFLPTVTASHVTSGKVGGGVAKPAAKPAWETTSPGNLARLTTIFK